MRLDLHMHSTASDGAYTPSEVVYIAQQQAMDLIALTDHDNVGGVLAAQEAARDSKLTVLAGVELSAEDDITDRHILGYLLDVEYLPLLSLLESLRTARVRRVEQIVAKLHALGLPVDLERVLKLAGTGSVGRPHVAQVMAEQGFVSNSREAFDVYIGDGKPAHVPHYRLSPYDAVDMIHRAGGVAVLAHPGHYNDYRAIINGLLPLGLDGIEVYYYDHTTEVTAELRRIAQQHNLLMTVGSDFHRREADGSARIGSVKFSPELQDLPAQLQARAERYR